MCLNGCDGLPEQQRDDAPKSVHPGKKKSRRILNVFIPIVAPLILGPFCDVAMGMAGKSVYEYSGRPRAVFRAQRIEA